MNEWIQFLNELDVAAVKTKVIVQLLEGNDKEEMSYQEEFDFGDM